MNYYWFDRQELFKKTKEKYNNRCGKKKAAKYYQDNKDVIREKAKNKYRNLTEKEKELQRKASRDRYNKIKSKK